MKRQRIVVMGRQRSTYWLMKRLVGLRGVEIPATALIGSEGILEGWIYTLLEGDSNSTRRQTNQESSAAIVIASHDIVQTNLLRFEAHLQVCIADREACSFAINSHSCNSH